MFGPVVSIFRAWDPKKPRLLLEIPGPYGITVLPPYQATVSFSSHLNLQFIRQREYPSNSNFQSCLHGLRHAHATMMLEEGINPKIVSERLGRSTIVITLDVYSNVLPGMQEAAGVGPGR
jgi:integrase